MCVYIYICIYVGLYMYIHIRRCVVGTVTRQSMACKHSSRLCVKDGGSRRLFLVVVSYVSPNLCALFIGVSCHTYEWAHMNLCALFIGVSCHTCALCALFIGVISHIHIQHTYIRSHACKNVWSHTWMWPDECVLRDAFIDLTRCIHRCDMTHWYVR